MLKHEDNPQAPSQPPAPPAAKVRVTPEELAAAVTALQIRKEGQPGTIAIGDAVEELGLDVTPEEVLAEVQARRATKKRPGPETRIRFLLAALAALVILSIWEMLQQPIGSHSVAVQPTPATSFIPAQSPAPQYIKVDPSLQVSDASHKILLLSEVDDDQPVEADYDYNNGSLVPYSSQSMYFSFTLIKHQGRIYIRGGMPRMSEQALIKDGADVTWDIEGRVPVTLPLRGFQVIPAMGNEDSGFHIVNVHLDKHAYEKW